MLGLPAMGGTACSLLSAPVMISAPLLLRLFTVCALAALTSCGTEEGTLESQESAATGAIARDRAAIDRPATPALAAPDAIADFDLTSGRLNRVPVSWYWAGQVWYPAYHQLFVRTLCAEARDDTTLIVTAVDELGRQETRYSDDTSHPEAGMGASRCSFVDLGYRTAATRYYVHVISKGRATARATVQYRLPYGPIPSTVYPFIPATNGWYDAPSNDGQLGFTEIGGTLVKVGPLQLGDSLEVQTVDQGHSGGTAANLNDTQLILFQLPPGLAENSATIGNSGLWNDNKNWGTGLADPANDLDPLITVGANFPFPESPSNYLVLGKVRRTVGPNEGTETRVDLVHGPLDQRVHVGAFPRSGGAGLPAFLSPGRYFAALSANIERPAGWSNPSNPATWNAVTYDMFSFSEDPKWFGATGEGHNCATSNGIGGGRRGQANEAAFVMTLERSTDQVRWVSVGSRVVQRASVSPVRARPSRFLLEVAVDSGAYYRLRASSVVPGVTFRSSEMVRNANASELKLVSANMLFNTREWTPIPITSAQEDNIYRNAADLFATRGEIQPFEFDTGAPLFRVRERPDQAAWQWEADIVGLNEVTRKCGGDETYCCGVNGNIGNACMGLRSSQPHVYGIEERWFDLPDAFRAEANARGSRRWNYQKGRGEFYTAPTGIPADRIPGFNPVFVADNVWPAEGINLDPRALADVGCMTDASDRDGVPGNYAACLLPGATDPGGVETGSSDTYDLDNYAVPARAMVRRFGTNTDRPVVVFNVHLEANDNDERLAEVRRWMDLVDLLLARTPGAFSTRADALASSARNPDLRLILQGDLNLQPHKCGEHYWIVEELRRHFGYAVDVAMALPHSADWMLGQHDAGTGYAAGGFPPGYQPYSDTRATDYRADGVQSPEAWQVTENMSGPLDAQPPGFPWWAATFRGKRTHPRSYSERHDLFVLVGQGWAGDDPVLNYAPMNVQNEVGSNPLHPDNRAVATLISTDCSNEVVRWDSPLSYAPSWPISPCGTTRGAPALHTDHIPIGARLRVW